MKLDSIKRLNREDFDEKDKSLIDRLSRIINDHMEQVLTALNKNLDFDNFKQELKDIDLEVDSFGVPKIPTTFKNGMNGKVIGTRVIKADNLTNPTISATGAPFLIFAEDNKIVRITKVLGIPADYKFRLRVVTYTQ